MSTLKVTSWNVEWMDKLYDASSNPTVQAHKQQRLVNIAEEIRDLDPDVLCMLEGPKNAARIRAFCTKQLGGDWTPMTLPDGVSYGIRGRQYIWFLVKTLLAPQCSLQDPTVWKSFAGTSWEVHYWGSFNSESHRHYRHPQVLVIDWQGTRVELIGMHLKSKFVRGGESDWNAGGQRREVFVTKALKARIKLTTEATNVRAYLTRRFEQHPSPAILVMGDLNDGPGKEHFEQKYLFFDLISNVQGDVFLARKFLNHALFDFEEDLRWSVRFDDFVSDQNDKPILLDHILFTQALVDGSAPLQVNPHAGLVEHEVHELINAGHPAAAVTSDHRPVSVKLDA